MKKRERKQFSKRNLALTIILGIFISIMIITLFNLVVTYFYEPPKYEDFCKNLEMDVYSVKYSANAQCANCTFSKELQEEIDTCNRENGIPIYNYDDKLCATSVKECNFCNEEFNNASENYNVNTFFIYAIIGFLIIVAGLFIHILLIQIVALPAGAFLVIEAAVKNFDDKLLVIIVFSLLIAAAIYLALKKLGNK